MQYTDNTTFLANVLEHHLSTERKKSIKCDVRMRQTTKYKSNCLEQHLIANN